MDLPKDYQYMLYRAPSIRYHDTSYIISRKWFKGEDELAFPLLHHYINLNEKIRGTNGYDSKSDRYATDSEANEKVKRKKTYKDKQQRYTRSLERSTKRSNSLEDVITTTDDDFLNEAQELKKINNNERIRSLLIDESEENVPLDNSAKKREQQINNVNNKKNIEINIVKFEIINDPNNKKNVSAAEKTDSESDAQSQSDKIKEQMTNDEETIAIIQQLDNNNYNQRKSEEPLTVNSRNEEMVSVDIHTRPTSTSSSSTISNHVLQISEDVTDNATVYYVKENTNSTHPQKIHNNQTDQINRSSSASTASNVTYISTGSQKTLTDLTRKSSNSPTGENFNYEGNCVQQAFILGNNLKSTSTVNEYEDDSSIDGSEIVVLRGNQDEYGNEHRIDPGYASVKYKSFPVQTKYLTQTQQKSLGAGNVKLHYVTQRILASILPAHKEVIDNEYIYESVRLRNEEDIQKNNEKEIILMLEQKHGKNYKIFDLESCISVITLERICELCKHIDKWLGSSKDKVVVLQDREDCQRLGVAIASYLEYLDICAANFPDMNKSNSRLTAHSEDLRAQNAINKNWLDLDMFSMKKFLEDFVGPLKIPSHRRYLRYFSGLLSGKIRMNSSPVLLNYILVESPPNLLQYHGSSSDAEWKSFIKIYEGLRCVFTSDIHIIPITTRQFLYQIGNLQLRGDILMRCYQVLSGDNDDHQFSGSRSSSRLTNDRNSYNNESRELLYSLQFHTCAMTSPEVIFRKNDLDYAWCDSRFPKDCKISLRFQSSDKPKEFFFQSPLIRMEKANSLAKADSIENFDLSSKYEGPVNGNLYAAILKSPKTINRSQPSPLTTQRSSSLSINFSSPASQSKHLSEGRSVDFDTNKKFSLGNTVVIREPENHLKTDNNYFVDQNTSQSNYYTGDRVSEYSQTQSHQLNRNISGRKQTTKNPLTLSLDSGISSTGLINRRQQCTSTSPSSFPSQTSPQDRHKELDDILNDMLMTVQDIPDYQNKSQKQRLIRSSSASATTSSSVQPTYFLLPATHRSRSYTATYGNIIQPSDRDYCDTASTATTVTPTPSESGRNTPIGQQHCNYQIQKRQRSNTVSSMASSNITTTATSSSVGHIHNNNNNYDQSSFYPQKRRTQKISFSETEDEDNIPYHARESSKPFTYGNVPNGHQLLETGNLVNGEKLIESINLEEDIEDPEKMIKLQPGLSSPSLVRKQLGPRVDGNLRKTQENEEFEDILRERREKIERQKLVNDQQFVNSHQSKKTNGYYYYNEPVKRSYNLEGFHRSNSTDGLSGSTWLQMQQQKLRAKKNQQFLGDRKYLETLHTDIRNVPTRSRIRNDGYASDTAAFGDEIDYRTPLVVQTQYYTDRSPKEKYNTIQTTRTTSYETKERPFVAVKRAHEHARSKRDGSPSLSPLSILKASPTGHLTQLDQNQNGLLLKANSSPSSGRAQLFENLKEANNNNAAEYACNDLIDNNFNVINLNNYHINHHNEPEIRETNLINDYKFNQCNYYSSTNTEADFNELVECNTENNNNFCKDNDNVLLNEQLVFDQLLSALTFEADLIARILAENNSKNSEGEDAKIGDDYKTCPSLCSTISDGFNNNNIISNERKNLEVHGQQFDELCSYKTDNLANPNKGQYVNELNKIIDNLNEFTKFEESRTSSFNNNNYYNQGSTKGVSNSNFSYNNSNLILLNYGTSRRLINVHCPESSENNSSISPSLSERSNNLNFWYDQFREESFSSYRSETDPELSMAGSPRPETPAFPTTPRTPYGFHTDGSVSPALPPKSPTSLRRLNNNSSWSLRSGRSTTPSKLDIRSNTNSEPQDVAAHHVKFVRDSSKYWYKPNISREEAIQILRYAEPGTFLVRDSTTFKNAFGLVLRVAHPPPGVQLKPGGDELVRHFLVEPTALGVRLKGCANEPVFSSLSALVYQHSITPLALPCRLVIPEQDIQAIEVHTTAQKQLLTQGAACNVFYLYACDTESLTGIEAVRRAVNRLYSKKPLPIPTEVHFKVSAQGITLTDNSRKKFFRYNTIYNDSCISQNKDISGYLVDGKYVEEIVSTKSLTEQKHYSANIISFCGLDPDLRTWSVKSQGDIPVNNKSIFAFVARRSSTSKDNQCHIFCDLQANQPASAIVSFANKVLPTEKLFNQHI